MEITIDDLKLLCTPIESKYIITYISDILTPEVFALFEEIFTSIFPLYSSGKLEYKNVCGPNANYICKNIIIRETSFRKIHITNKNWKKPVNWDTIEYLNTIYGLDRWTAIGAAYHALPYIEIIIDTKTYYIAIETTNCSKYKLQYYIGGSAEELKKILTARYQCLDYQIIGDCEKTMGGKRKYKKRSSRKYKKKRTVKAR